MRRYDDPVEVRRGQVSGPGGDQEGPEQFLWRGRVWKVRSVLAHWVETGPWWRPTGSEASVATPTPTPTWTPDLLQEREWWRVEAARPSGHQPHQGSQGSPAVNTGVFELSFDWSGGTWQLVGCAD